MFSMIWITVLCVVAIPFCLSVVVARKLQFFNAIFFVFGAVVTAIILGKIGFDAYPKEVDDDSIGGLIIFGTVGAISGFVCWFVASRLRQRQHG